MGVYWMSGPGILCVDVSKLVKTEGFRRQMKALKEIRQMCKRPKNEGKTKEWAKVTDNRAEPTLIDEGMGV